MISNPNQHGQVHDESELVRRIRGSAGGRDIVSTTLKTDERVIARITDGIYRQPGSAFRELIWVVGQSETCSARTTPL